MKKKTFAEKIGEDNALQLIEFFLQNDTFDRPKLSEIVELMPEAKFTIGRLVGLRRDHAEEIKMLKVAYLVQFAKVPPVGKSNSVPPRRSRERALRMGGLSPLATQLLVLRNDECHRIEGDRYCAERPARMYGSAGPYCRRHKPQQAR